MDESIYGLGEGVCGRNEQFPSTNFKFPLSFAEDTERIWREYLGTTGVEWRRVV